jgi:hypothetical protein
MKVFKKKKNEDEYLLDGCYSNISNNNNNSSHNISTSALQVPLILRVNKIIAGSLYNSQDVSSVP